MGFNPFVRCYKLTNIDVQSPNFVLENDVLFNSDKSVLISCLVNKSGTYDIPVGVVEIGSHAFSDCDKLTEINIPNTVETIKYWAFLYCNGLTDIELPNSLKRIDSRAFDFCNGIESVVIPESVEYLGEEPFNFVSLKKLTFLGNAPDGPSSLIEYYHDNDFNTQVDIYYSGTGFEKYDNNIRINWIKQ